MMTGRTQTGDEIKVMIIGQPSGNPNLNNHNLRNQNRPDLDGIRVNPIPDPIPQNQGGGGGG